MMMWLFPRLRTARSDLRLALTRLAYADAERVRLCAALTQQRNANRRLADNNIRLTGENRELRAELEGATKALNALTGGQGDLPDLDLVMGSDADALQGVAEADATMLLDSLATGVTDTSGLVLHRQCERAHQRGDHGRECALCKEPLHPAVVSDAG